MPFNLMGMGLLTESPLTGSPIFNVLVDFPRPGLENHPQKSDGERLPARGGKGWFVGSAVGGHRAVDFPRATIFDGCDTAVRIGIGMGARSLLARTLSPSATKPLRLSMVAAAAAAAGAGIVVSGSGDTTSLRALAAISEELADCHRPPPLSPDDAGVDTHAVTI